MRFTLLGMNHRTADVALRERATLGAADLPAALAGLRSAFPGCEAVVLSTCNRTEFYLAHPASSAIDADALRDWWAQRRPVSRDELGGATVEREQAAAVRHLFRVAGGLDSRVVGEPEVQHQVKRAYDAACDAETAGPVMHQVFQATIAAARKARRETGLSRQSASVGSVALQFARTVFDTLEGKTIGCIGAGEIAKSTLRRLLRQNPQKTWIVNRTPANARELAGAMNLEPPNGGPRAWDDLEAVVVESDVLICATGAPEPILAEAWMRPLIRKRRSRPLVVLDLAVPRDVEERVGGLKNVFLYNIDDLCEVVDHDPQRQQAIRDCEQQLAAAASTCHRRLQHRDVGQLVRQLRHKMQSMADQEQQRSLRKLGSRLNDDERDAVEALLGELGHRLINKFLHLPLQQLDATREDGSLGFYAAALRRLFDLQDDESTDREDSPDAHNADHPTTSESSKIHIKTPTPGGHELHSCSARPPSHKDDNRAAD